MLIDTNVTMAKIQQAGATNGQVLKWNGSAWAPSQDSASGLPIGIAGGDLTGTYPSPTIADNAVTSAKILDSTIKGADIAIPCTLEASTSFSLQANALPKTRNNGSKDAIGAVLNIRNTGIGGGIKVIDAGFDGINVSHANGADVSVSTTDQDAFNVGTADWSGLYIWHTGEMRFMLIVPIATD